MRSETSEERRPKRGPEQRREFLETAFAVVERRGNVGDVVAGRCLRSERLDEGVGPLPHERLDGCALLLVERHEAGGGGGGGGGKPRAGGGAPRLGPTSASRPKMRVSWINAGEKDIHRS